MVDQWKKRPYPCDMDVFSTYRNLIDLWPTRAVLASDLGVGVARVHKWFQSNAIPAKYQRPIMDAAQARGFDVTAEDMIRLSDTSREENSQGTAA